MISEEEWAQEREDKTFELREVFECLLLARLFKVTLSRNVENVLLQSRMIFVTSLIFMLR